MGLRILGPLELTCQSRTFKVGGPREHIVLAMLALRANRVTSVDQLMDAVWGEHPPSTARGQIQGCISGLRKLFGDVGLPDAITTSGSGYKLSLTVESLDAEEFSALVVLARGQVADGRTDAAATTLRAALRLWRGAALDGITSDPVRRAAAMLDDARLAATEERLRLELELGKHQEVIGELFELVAEHPLRERLHGFLVLALYRAGRQSDALDAARRVRGILVEELGIEPGQELRDLERAVLNRDPALNLGSDVGGGTAAGPAGAGETVERQVVSPHQLPSGTADFVGRGTDIEQIRHFFEEQLQDDRVRYAVPVLGIWGRGGVGKSTLALRIAHEWGDRFPDGHLYVDLHGPEAEDRPAALLARFLRALGVNGLMIPDDPAERGEMYRSRLANKRLLLVLDGVRTEDQVRPLLPGSPSCVVVITSRTRLGALTGAEWVSLNSFDHETAIEFLATIVGRKRLDAEPEATDELVAYCGGLPLALRIAGARLASRPHWRIAELARRLKNEVRRLDELSHRGMELRSSIALSYRSLAERSKRLFRLFAMVQSPDFPVWAAAALLDTDLFEAQDALERLVDVQMLDVLDRPGRTVRYRFHDLIRGYARERLAATETDAERQEALTRLVSGWLALAEHAHRMEYGGDYTILHGNAPRLRLEDWLDEEILGSPMDWLEQERAELVSVIRHAARAGLDEMCWDLALTSVSLFEVKGYFDDWRETSEIAYAACRQAGNRFGCAAMRYSLGSLAAAQKRINDAQEHFDAALREFTELGSLHGQALVLRDSTFLDRLRGDIEPMLAKYERSLQLMREVGDVIGEANILRSLAKFRIDEGELDAARAMLADALELCRVAGYRRGEAQVATRFAELHLRSGQVGLARQTLMAVLTTVREIGDRIGEAHALYGLGIVRRREGHLDTAESTFAHALAIAEQVGDRLIEGQARYALGELSIARHDTAVAAEHLGAAQATFADLGSALWLARTVLLLTELRETTADQPSADPTVLEAIGMLRKIESKEASLLLRQLEGQYVMPEGPAADSQPAPPQF